MYDVKGNRFAAYTYKDLLKNPEPFFRQLKAGNYFIAKDPMGGEDKVFKKSAFQFGGQDPKIKFNKALKVLERDITRAEKKAQNQEQPEDNATPEKISSGTQSDALAKTLPGRTGDPAFLKTLPGTPISTNPKDEEEITPGDEKPLQNTTQSGTISPEGPREQKVKEYLNNILKYLEENNKIPENILLLKHTNPKKYFKILDSMIAQQFNKTYGSKGNSTEEIINKARQIDLKQNTQKSDPTTPGDKEALQKLLHQAVKDQKRIKKGSPQPPQPVVQKQKTNTLQGQPPQPVVQKQKTNTLQGQPPQPVAQTATPAETDRGTRTLLKYLGNIFRSTGMSDKEVRSEVQSTFKILNSTEKMDEKAKQYWEDQLDHYFPNWRQETGWAASQKQKVNTLQGGQPLDYRKPEGAPNRLVPEPPISSKETPKQARPSVPQAPFDPEAEKRLGQFDIEDDENYDLRGERNKAKPNIKTPTLSPAVSPQQIASREEEAYAPLDKEDRNLIKSVVADPASFATLSPEEHDKFKRFLGTSEDKQSLDAADIERLSSLAKRKPSDSPMRKKGEIGPAAFAGHSTSKAAEKSIPQAAPQEPEVKKPEVASTQGKGEIFNKISDLLKSRKSPLANQEPAKTSTPPAAKKPELKPVQGEQDPIAQSINRNKQVRQDIQAEPPKAPEKKPEPVKPESTKSTKPEPTKPAEPETKKTEPAKTPEKKPQISDEEFMANHERNQSQVLNLLGLTRDGKNLKAAPKASEEPAKSQEPAKEPFKPLPKEPARRPLPPVTSNTPEEETNIGKNTLTNLQRALGSNTIPPTSTPEDVSKRAKGKLKPRPK